MWVFSKFSATNLSFALLLLISCSQTAHTHSDVEHDHTHDHAHSHQHEHEHKARKPTAGLQFSYEHDFESQLNQSGSMTLRVMHQYEDGRLSLEMVGSNGVEINHGSTSRSFAMTKPGFIDWNVSYRPTQEGTGYVSVIATVTLSDGNELGQAYSIPIRTGETTPNSAAKDVTEVIMEAEEIIID